MRSATVPARSILSSRYEEGSRARHVRRVKGERRRCLDRVLARIASGEYRLEEAACPCCGKSEADLVAAFDRYFVPVRIVLCRTCGMVYQALRPDQESLARFYAEEYREMYNPGLRGDVDAYRRGLETPVPVFDKILGWLGATPGLVFEVGMHFGALLHMFQERGCRVAGTDFDPAATAFARDEAGIKAFTGPSTTLLQLNEQADLLMYVHVLEHINDLDAEFSVMRALVRDGGHLFLSVPGLLHWAQHKGNDVFCTLQLAHTWYFSLSHLAFIAARHGFRLVHGDDCADALFVKEEGALALALPDEYKRNADQLRAMHRAWSRARMLGKLRRLFRMKS